MRFNVKRIVEHVQRPSSVSHNGFTLKDVQEYMGHVDIQMTANIYGHPDMQRKQLLTEKMASSLF